MNKLNALEAAIISECLKQFPESKTIPEALTLMTGEIIKQLDNKQWKRKDIEVIEYLSLQYRMLSRLAYTHGSRREDSTVVLTFNRN